MTGPRSALGIAPTPGRRQPIGKTGPTAFARSGSRVLRSLAVLVLVTFIQPALAVDGRTPTPTIEAARAGTTCIADPATMRREHPSMLKHQRDLTVHGGIRGGKASLKDCIACHASATSGSVAQNQENFCVSCHSYTAVRIDCFSCHATRPAQTAAKKLP